LTTCSRPRNRTAQRTPTTGKATTTPPTPQQLTSLGPLQPLTTSPARDPGWRQPRTAVSQTTRQVNITFTQHSKIDTFYTDRTPTTGRKYDRRNWHKTGVSEWPTGVSQSLMGAAYSKNSWHRHHAALNSYITYTQHAGKAYIFPFPIDMIRGYVAWAINVKHLQPNSVRVYISDLKLAHNLRDIDTSAFDDFFVKKMLKGADHLNMYESIKNKTKLVMTFQMLKILGHEIAKSNWTTEKKRLFWCMSCLGFFGSFRMGELLATERGGSYENLKWSDVKFRTDNSVLINIRFPKIIKNKNGDFADIFPIENASYCPVSTLKALSKYKKSENDFVFSYRNGSCITVKDFSAELKTLLTPVFGIAIANLSGHSFRAGIPAALCNRPDIANEDDVKIWGRWSSEAYKAYTKLKMTARKIIFSKIMCAIM